MKVFISGGGTIGYIVAEYMMREGHDVTVVEHRPAEVKFLQDLLDIHVVAGRASDLDTLQEAGVQNSDIFLALTDHDEANVLACTFAKRAGAKRTVARFNELHYLSRQTAVSLKELGIDDFVEAEHCLVENILKLISFPGAADIKSFLDKQYRVAHFTFTRSSPHYGKQLGELPVPVSAVALGYMKVSDFLPFDPTVRITEFTYVCYGCPAEEFEGLYKVLYPEKRAMERVTVFGGDYRNAATPLFLSDELLALGVRDVTLVTDEPEIAQRLSTKASVNVLLGDPSKPSFSRIEKIAGQDAFISLSGNFERNLFASSVASRMGVPHTYAVVRYPEHVSFMSTLPLTSFLNPALIAANMIMRFVTPGHIISRSVISYEQAECLEFVVRGGSRYDGVRAGDVGSGSSRIVAGLRDGKLLLPNSDWQLREGDRVLLFAMETGTEIIKKLL
jgi:trk system potassium uptake protein TrkA